MDRADGGASTRHAPSGQPPQLHFLDLPTEVIASVVARVTTRDKLQNVARTCRALRDLLRHPTPGMYGQIRIKPRDKSKYHSVGAYESLSNWLDMRAAGITLLTVDIDPKIASFPLDHLMFWLLGNHSSFKYSVVIQKGAPVDLNFSLLAPCVRPVAAKLLVKLEVTTNASIWQNLFELTALQSLTLKVFPKANAASVDISALQPSLPDLRFLQLANCTASLAPMLAVAASPKLSTVNILSCRPPDDIDLSKLAQSSTLRSLVISNCGKLQMLSFAAMRRLVYLELGSPWPVDWQMALQGASQLQTLVVHANDHLNADLVSVIRSLSGLQSVVIGGTEGCGVSALFYGAQIAQLMRSRGKTLRWTAPLK